MPLNKKGKEILAKLQEEYGEEEGKRILYAGKNSGKFTGIDANDSELQEIADADGQLWTRGVTLSDVGLMDGVRTTTDGYLVCDAKVARAGVQHYRGSEVGRHNQERVALFRPENEVFARDTMHSMANKPITLNHPNKMVGKDNWSKHAKGFSGSDVVRDGEYIRVPLMLTDSAAIKAYESGEARELSVGYTTDISWKEGKTEQGEYYHGIQNNIHCNHHALVPEARGGSTLRFGDASKSAQDDTVELTVPLLIRLMEFAREDAPEGEEGDLAVHKAVERVVTQSCEGPVGMDTYKKVVAGDGLGDGRWLKAPPIGYEFSEGSVRYCVTRVESGVVSYKPVGGGDSEGCDLDKFHEVAGPPPPTMKDSSAMWEDCGDGSKARSTDHGQYTIKAKLEDDAKDGDPKGHWLTFTPTGKDALPLGFYKTPMGAQNAAQTHHETMEAAAGATKTADAAPYWMADEDLTVEKRRELAKKNLAKPDGSYPIRNVGELEKAIQAWGRGGATQSDKNWIIKRARALGEDELLKRALALGETKDAKCVRDKRNRNMTLTNTFDGVSVEFADEVSAGNMAAVFDSLKKKLRDAEKAAKEKDDEEEEAKESEAEKQKENDRKAKDAKEKMDAKDGEIAMLKKQLQDAKDAVNPAMLDAMLAERESVKDAARKVLPSNFTFDGKSVSDIRRAAVVAKLGDSAKDASTFPEAAITGAFVALTAHAPKDGGSGVRRMADAISDTARDGRREDDRVRSLADGIQQRDAAYADYVASLTKPKTVVYNRQ